MADPVFFPRCWRPCVLLPYILFLSILVASATASLRAQSNGACLDLAKALEQPGESGEAIQGLAAALVSCHASRARLQSAWCFGVLTVISCRLTKTPPPPPPPPPPRCKRPGAARRREKTPRIKRNCRRRNCGFGEIRGRTKSSLNRQSPHRQRSAAGSSLSQRGTRVTWQIRSSFSLPKRNRIRPSPQRRLPFQRPPEG